MKIGGLVTNGPVCWAIGVQISGCPPFRDKQSSIRARQVEDIPNDVARQVDAIDGFGELARQTNLHTCPTKARTGWAGVAEVYAIAAR